MTVKRKSPWRPHRPSDAATMRAPKFLPGDPVHEVGVPDEVGMVDYARSDGQVCIKWASQRREWRHEDVLQWPASFTPTGRRN